MNKELIKKYKAEFDHWLNGGEILFHDNDHGWHPLHPNASWEKSLENQLKYGKYGYVIDDEYVEFRKALAEGKTVQYYVDSFAGWQDVTTIGDHSIKGAKEYRIKPNEPKFKFGDWVTFREHIIKLESKHFTLPDIWWDNIQTWKPQQGEWCWFWNLVTPKLGQYGGRLDNGQFYTIKDNYYSHCEPFIGKLPSHLKDTVC